MLHCSPAAASEEDEEKEVNRIWINYLPPPLTAIKWTLQSRADQSPRRCMLMTTRDDKLWWKKLISWQQINGSYIQSVCLCSCCFCGCEEVNLHRMWYSAEERSRWRTSSTCEYTSSFSSSSMSHTRCRCRFFSHHQFRRSIDIIFILPHHTHPMPPAGAARGVQV